MVEGIFEEVSFRPDKYMAKESCKVFAELADIEDFHLEGNVEDSGPLLNQNVRTAFSSQPGRHISCTTENLIAPDGSYQIIND